MMRMLHIASDGWRHCRLRCAGGAPVAFVHANLQRAVGRLGCKRTCWLSSCVACTMHAAPIWTYKGEDPPVDPGAFARIVTQVYA